jgi:transcriptional regulator GlxA family with amidase domain
MVFWPNRETLADTMTDNTTQTIQITFVLSEHMLTTGTTLPLEMLQTAQLARHQSAQASPVNLAMRTAVAPGTQLPTPTGMRWAPDATLAEAGNNDIIYLPALWRNPRPVLRRAGALIEWLKEQHHNGATICGVGTGCCFLAEAGLLDDKVATTHWHYFDQFQKNYPNVQLKRQHFITQAGNLYCAASVNSLADLTVYFIQRLMGKTVASHVERHFSHEIRRSYESSAFYEDTSHPHPDETIIQIQLWIRDNYSRPITVADLARRFGMSTRTLNRRFKNATDTTPLAYLREIRIKIARELLKTSNLSIVEVAEKSGYQDSAYFAELFKQQLGTTPSAYREMVRAKLFRTD